jgi:hypothetical protein
MPRWQRDVRCRSSGASHQSSRSFARRGRDARLRSSERSASLRVRSGTREAVEGQSHCPQAAWGGFRRIVALRHGVTRKTALCRSFAMEPGWAILGSNQGSTTRIRRGRRNRSKGPNPRTCWAIRPGCLREPEGHPHETAASSPALRGGQGSSRISREHGAVGNAVETVRLARGCVQTSIPQPARRPRKRASRLRETTSLANRLRAPC